MLQIAHSKYTFKERIKSFLLTILPYIELQLQYCVLVIQLLYYICVVYDARCNMKPASNIVKKVLSVAKNQIGVLGRVR